MNIINRAKKYIGTTINCCGFGGKVTDVVTVKRDDTITLRFKDNTPLDGHCSIEWNRGKTAALCFKCSTSGGYNFYVEVPPHFRNVKVI